MGRIGARRTAIVLIGILAVAAPIVASVYLAQRQSLDKQRERAEQLAQVVMLRAEGIRRQLGQAFASLERADAEPCSERSLTEMRAIAIRADHLAGVGFIADDMLLCSSFGRHENGVPVGPPDYRSGVGVDVRIRRELPNAPGPQLMLATIASGHTGFVHPGHAIAVAEEDPSVSLYVSGQTSGQPLAVRGRFDPEWLEDAAAPGRASGWRLHGDHIVAWRRSTVWDLVAFAAIPTSEAARDTEQMALTLTPIGLLAGGILFLAGYYTVQHNSSMQALLRAALRRNELVVHYQPIVDLGDERWVGAEALARWRRPSGEWVDPEIFIPIAERHGLMDILTRRVAERALGEIAAVVARHPDFFVTINMGASELVSPSLRAHLCDLLRTYRLLPKNVHIELTEREIADSERIRKAIGAYQALGFTIAADDFGVGYSNLSYLEAFHLDCLKIDRLFLNSQRFDTGHKQTIAHIIEMAQERGIQLIVEGIETEQQLGFLKDRGVEFGQGWLFAKAMPIRELDQALSHNAIERRHRPPEMSNSAPVT